MDTPAGPRSLPIPESGSDIPPSAPFPYPIRTYTPADETAALRLLRMTVVGAYASGDATAHWRWKHVESPFGPSYGVCAWDDRAEELVGLRTLMRWSLRARDGSSHQVVRAVDTATHPSYQRKGIFSTLTRFAIEDLRRQGVPFIFNTPNRNSLPGYLKMGWRLVARWPIYLRAVRWSRVARKLLRRRASGDALSGRTDSSGLERWQPFRDRHRTELEVLLAAHETLRRQVGYRTERDLAYLDWRYGSHPDSEYVVHPLRSDAGLEGLLVGRPVAGFLGLEAFVITEMILRDPTPREGARLLKSLLRKCESDYLVAHFAPGTIERRALFRTGFMHAPGRGCTFVARPLNRGGDDPTEARSWDLTMGELEIF